MRHLAGASVLALLAGCSDIPKVVAPGEDAALAWINQTATPLTSVTPTTSRADLSAFTTLVGSARLIGLGEATHGSREFFTMKDRLFRHLVEDAGVTGFAMEATMPEAFGIDTYVRTGVGDPKVLLSHLYFWMWNTQEVLDLIVWLRQWNQQHPGKQVGFYGFDMQYPGIAIDSVKSYIARVRPTLSATIDSSYACLADYRNDTHGVSQKSYSTAPNVWSACGKGIAAAQSTLNDQQAALIAASSEREFSLALQMSHIVVQWDQLMRNLSGPFRDVSMAENIKWLLDREGPGGKLVVWAHNFHISRYPGSMGASLAGRYGPDYLPIGFGFSSGGFNAIENQGNGVAGSLKPLVAPPPVTDSYEAVLQQAKVPNFYIDLRQPAADTLVWFDKGHRFRSIGAIYDVKDPEYHYTTVVLPIIYDVMIFIRDVTPSTLLPFQY